MPAARSRSPPTPQTSIRGSSWRSARDQLGAVQVARRLARHQQDLARFVGPRCGTHSVSNVVADALGDLQGAQRRAAVDERRLARAHGVHEVLDLVEERVGVAEVVLVDGDDRRRPRPGRRRQTRTCFSPKSTET